jgi:two-component system sensor histidine kinase AdeS
MSAGTSLRRQIILSLTIMVLGVIFLSIVGTYVFYALASVYSPVRILQTWVPSRVELAWVLGTTLAALCIAGYVAFRLSSLILTPLDSVAQNLREVGLGHLQAGASAGEHARGETAQLAHDFNT